MGDKGTEVNGKDLCDTKTASPKPTKKVDEKTEKKGNDSDKQIVRSYADIRGEWEERSISIFGAVKSFIGQLKIGQDLTRVSLPCVFLRPYSLLEEVASRHCCHFYLLFEVQDKKTPLKRMLAILRYLISTARQENFNHKPFNPVIGEINRCSFIHEETDVTHILVEQVVHHPPTCGMRIDNPSRSISVEGHHTFQVRFNRNSVTVANNGRTNIRIGNESYIMSKAMPDLLIKNTIIGTKQVVWEGNINMKCPESGYFADFEMITKSKENLVKGKVFSPESTTEPLVFVDGKTGGPASWHYNSKHPSFQQTATASPEENGKKKKKSEKDKKKKIEKERELVEDPAVRRVDVPSYTSEQAAHSSIKTWEAVAKCIVENNMDQGDVEKQKIEDKQRAFIRGLEEKGQPYEPAHFVVDKEYGSWKIKDPDWYKK